MDRKWQQYGPLDDSTPSVLVFYTAATCNLKCSYCEIDKILNGTKNQLLEDTIQALKDDTYLNNCVKTL